MNPTTFKIKLPKMTTEEKARAFDALVKQNEAIGEIAAEKFHENNDVWDGAFQQVRDRAYGKSCVSNATRLALKSQIQDIVEDVKSGAL